jgi:hypothetical protein
MPQKKKKKKKTVGKIISDSELPLRDFSTVPKATPLLSQLLFLNKVVTLAVDKMDVILCFAYVVSFGDSF